MYSYGRNSAKNLVSHLASLGIQGGIAQDSLWQVLVIIVFFLFLLDPDEADVEEFITTERATKLLGGTRSQMLAVSLMRKANSAQ